LFLMLDSAWEMTMGRPYSQDLRDRVLSAVDGGMPPSEVAELLRSMSPTFTRY
jgi:hypothetical protein